MIQISWQILIQTEHTYMYRNNKCTTKKKLNWETEYAMHPR